MPTLNIKKNTNENEEFINLLKETKNKIVDYEEYGNDIDFIDEDGIVIMQVRGTEDPECVEVLFTSEDQAYKVNKSEISNLK